MTKDPDSKEPASPESARPISWLRIWGELAGVWAIALAHPIYANIASGPEALTAYGVRRLDLLVLILVVSLLGPLLISLAELAIRRLFGDRPRQVIHGLAVGGLLSLVVWQWLLDRGTPEFIRDLVPLGLALLVAWLYVKTELVRNFALILSFATVVVIISFCIDYPIKDEVLPHETAASTPKIESDTPVVVVIFDELPLAALETPNGRIDPRFRSFARLADKSYWYRDAVSVADQTTLALPSILTGEDPDSHEGTKAPPPGLANYPNSICEIAANGGYQVHAYEPITDLCQRFWDFGTRITATIRRAVGADDPNWTDALLPGRLDQKIARALGSPFRLPYSELDEGRREAFNEFIDGLPTDRRSLSVIHITLPHVHWIYLPDGKSYPNFRNLGESQLISPPSQAEVNRDAQQMMLQLRFTDRELGKLIRKMKSDGTWDESLFVVTADHGAAFQKGGSRRMVNYVNAGWIMPVPLFIKFPNQQTGRIVRGTVDGRSIAPTVLGQLGLKKLDGMHGQDLAGVKRLPMKENSEIHATIGGSTPIDQKGTRLERQAASQQMKRLLGQSFYALGGHPDLLGRKPVGLTEVPATPTDPAAYENVDTSSEKVPAYFEATVEPPDGGNPGPLAIALNGRIVATTRAWPWFGGWKTGVVMPAESLRDGDNEIRVYEIGTGNRASL